MSDIPRGSVTALVLAGDRGPDDPVAREAGVCCKALAPVAGRPMLLRVLDTLAAVDAVGDVVISGPADAGVEANRELRDALATPGLRRTPLGPGPSASAMLALETIPDDRPVLLTTADHALLRPQVAAGFLLRAATSDYDVLAAVIRYRDFAAAYPGQAKTQLRFSDDSYCGCNLFALLTPRGRRIVQAWQQVEAQRKTPWKTIGLLGVGSILRYILGRLSLADATARLSQRLGLRVGVIVLPWPEAAIDVDTPADRLFAEQLAQQSASAPTDHYAEHEQA